MRGEKNNTQGGKSGEKKAQQSKTSPWVGLQQLRILQVWKQYWREESREPGASRKSNN